MNPNTATTLDPQVLGFWTRCMREASHCSQEALAASSNLTVRTIQRIEAGERTTVATRRSLARGLGYEDVTIFDSPEFIETATNLIGDLQKLREEEFKEQFPNHVAVKVHRVTSGRQIGSVADCDAYTGDVSGNLSDDIKNTAAAIFDYVRDLGDIIGELTHADRLSFEAELEALLAELEKHGAWMYVGRGSTSAGDKSLSGEKPLRLKLGYLLVVPTGTVTKEMMVPKEFSWAS